MNEQELSAIEARANKASNAPWIIEAGEYSGRNWLVGTITVNLGESYRDEQVYFVTTQNVHASELEEDAKTDAEFIAHAREDVPVLVAEVRRLTDENTELNRRLVIRDDLADAVRAIYDDVPVGNWTRKPLRVIRDWLASLGKQVPL